MKAIPFYVLLSSITGVSAIGGWNGFMGYGMDFYDLPCAHGCADAMPTSVYCAPNLIKSGKSKRSIPVVNTTEAAGIVYDGSSNATVATTKPTDACLANYVPYLQSVAYCVKTHCKDSKPGHISQWWYDGLFSGKHRTITATPAISYGAALYTLSSAPNATLEEGDTIVTPVLVDEASYLKSFNAKNNFDKAEKFHTAYGLAVLIITAAVPIAVSLLRFVVSEKILRYLTSRIIDAPLIERFSLSYGTRGDLLMFAYLTAINMAACFADIHSAQPNTFWTRGVELTRYIANRSGTISFANIPLAILFASRNNFLLWITNWNYHTFMTMHKQVAFWATIEACLHSAMYLQYSVVNHVVHAYAIKPFWTLGIVATLAMSVAIVHSLPMIRNAAYETFVLIHRAMAIITVAGCWYHIILRYGRLYGYENWIIIAIVIWGFEHFLRYSRMLYNRLRYAHITKVDEDYIRIDIPDLSSSHYVYLYFIPDTILGLRRFRPWESHPFSVLCSNAALKDGPEWVSKEEESLKGSSDSSQLYERDSSGVAEKSMGGHDSGLKDGTRETSIQYSKKVNSTFIVKVRRGLTHSLLTRIGKVPIPVLVEASYGSYWANNILSEIKLQSAEYPNVLFIAGGVGITPLVQTMLDLTYSTSRLGHVDLYWSSRSNELVAEVESILREYHRGVGIHSTWGTTNAIINTDSRHHLPDVLNEKSLRNVGTRVIVCGPDSMICEARTLTAALARSGLAVKFVSENFGW